MTQDIRQLPAIRALAEERARSYWSAVQGIVPTAAPWEQTPDYGKEVQIGAHLAIITDLSRPDSRDAIARLVAAKVGIECGATAPEFRQTTGSLGGWVLNGGKGVRSVHEFVTRAPHPARGNLPTRGVTLVPALLGVNDPAEALRLIALAVLA